MREDQPLAELGFEPQEEQYYFFVQKEVMRAMIAELGISEAQWVERFAAKTSDLIRNEESVTLGVRRNDPEVIKAIVDRLLLKERPGSQKAA